MICSIVVSELKEGSNHKERLVLLTRLSSVDSSLRQFADTDADALVRLSNRNRRTNHD